MRFSVAAFALASVALVAAQTPSPYPTGGSCAAQNILDTCLTSERIKADACAGNDWLCLCDTYNNILTCYNNCPNDLARSSVNNQVVQFCGAAAPALSSRSEAARLAPKTTATPTPTGSGSGAAATGANKSNFEGFGSSPTGSASGARGTGAALAMSQFAGGALAAVGIVVGML